MTALSTRPEAAALTTYDPATLDVLRKVLCPTLNDTELVFAGLAFQRMGLDPFRKQVYVQKRLDRRTQTYRLIFITSIDGYRAKAQTSGQYRGQLPMLWCGADGVWKDVWLTPNQPPAAAKCRVLREGADEPIEAIALRAEYLDDNNPMWKHMPAAHLAKCAEALALRRAFPEELAGLHADVEMDQTDRPKPPPAPRIKRTTDLNAELGIDQPAAPSPAADDVPASITTPDIVDAEQAQQPVVPPPLDAGEQARKDLASAARAWCGIPAADLPVVALINSIARAMGLSMPPAGERYSDAQIKLMADWVAAKVAKKIDYTKATTPA